MTLSDIREILAEEAEVERRQEALASLVCARSKLLRESLEARMQRAQDEGDWSHLSHSECAGLHGEEKRYLKSQVNILRFEQARTEKRMAALRRMEARAKRIRAAEVAPGRKRSR